MQIKDVEISLVELQEALSDYCDKHDMKGVKRVHVVSYKRTRICVELTDEGVVEASDFRHRAHQVEDGN